MKRLTQFDGIRGLAVLLVVLHHLVKYLTFGVGKNMVAIVPYRILDAGWVGVDIFFVLSGFLITGIILKDRSDADFWSSFYARRSFRILPAFGAVFLLTFLAVHFLAPDLRISPIYVFAATFFMANWMIFAKEVPKFFYHFWSLAVEEQFYLLWPQGAKRLKDSTLIKIALSLAIVSCLLRVILAVLHVDAFVVYNITPTRIDGLSLGAALAIGVTLPSVRRVLSFWWKRIALVAASMLPFIFLALGGNMFVASVWSQVFTIPVVIVLTSMLIFGVLESALPASLAWFFSSSVMSWLGRRSYALYLIHPPVQFALERIRAQGYLQKLPHGVAGNAVVLVASLTISLILTEISWVLVESPAQQLRRRWMRSREEGNRARTSDAEAITSLANQS